MGRYTITAWGAILYLRVSTKMAIGPVLTITYLEHNHCTHISNKVRTSGVRSVRGTVYRIVWYHIYTTNIAALSASLLGK